MASIYHIENDIDCNVLHFGKELCIARAGDDSVITLLKGRHKLTFVSLENVSDAYTIVFEVLEDGIEDFIDVNLLPIRNERIEEENKNEEARRRKLEEQRRIEEENRLKLLAEEQRRLEEEIEAQKRKLKEEEERAEEERLKALKEKEHQENLRKIEIQKENLHDKIVSSFKKVRSFIDEMADIDGYLYHECRWVQKKAEQSEDENIEDTHEIVYNLYRGENQIHDWDFTEVNRFSDGLALVKHDKKYYYIDIQGDIKLGPYEYATNFKDESAYIYKRGNYGLVGFICKIDLQGRFKQTYYECVFPLRDVVDTMKLFPYIYITHSTNKSTNVFSVNIYCCGELIHKMNLINRDSNSRVHSVRGPWLSIDGLFNGLSYEYNNHNRYIIDIIKSVHIQAIIYFAISERLQVFCLEINNDTDGHACTIIINNYGEVVALKNMVIPVGGIETDVNALILEDEDGSIHLYDQSGVELAN